jgi:hypothetical protein
MASGSGDRKLGGGTAALMALGAFMRLAPRAHAARAIGGATERSNSGTSSDGPYEPGKSYSVPQGSLPEPPPGYAWAVEGPDLIKRGHVFVTLVQKEATYVPGNLYSVAQDRLPPPHLGWAWCFLGEDAHEAGQWVAKLVSTKRAKTPTWVVGHMYVFPRSDMPLPPEGSSWDVRGTHPGDPSHVTAILQRV